MKITNLYKFFSKASEVDMPEVTEQGSRDILMYTCDKCGAKFFGEQAADFNFCPVCRNNKQPYHEIMCLFDEAFTIDEMLEETSMCRNCSNIDCPNCGKEAI